MVRQVVVTGSASGIGAATAAILAAQGDQVIGIDQRDADVIADLATAQGRLAAASGVLDRTENHVDAVVACAGTSTSTDLDVKVNYFGVVELLDALRPALASASAPRVSITSSFASVMHTDPDLIAACLAGEEEQALKLAAELVAAGQARHLYNSSKCAVSKWVRRSAITDEWAGAGIALNAVGPGVVMTPMTEDLRSTAEGVALVNQAVPAKLGGWMAPEVIADVLVWLIRPENTHTTGQMIFVDGGAEAVVRGQEMF